ncbi:MAG: mechanosensitive ion channel family protein [Anaerolineales bacterium]|jgi:small conductance mechanosensitive channel|nr:mechanosensitive ion channel family protein [Anaerolineales bacterium]
MEDLLNELLRTVTSHLALILRVVVIAGVAWLGIYLSTKFQKRVERRIIERHLSQAQQARLKTLLRAGSSIGKVIIISLASLMILQTFGINITPILASAGVAGLAVSLGAQTLIRDYIGGAIILFEEAFYVGEIIEVNGVVGTVEQIELRATQVRDLTGKLITIPNGEIRILANSSRGWNRAVVDLNLSLETDIGLSIATLQSAVAQACQDEPLKSLLLETPQIQGWNNLNEWSVQVRIQAKTQAGKQADAAVLLRKAALLAIQEAGIQMASVSRINQAAFSEPPGKA